MILLALFVILTLASIVMLVLSSQRSEALIASVILLIMIALVRWLGV